MVTDWLIKHWKLLVAIALFILFVIIGSTIWITITSDHWFSKLILKYFDSWSIALGAAATVTLAIVAFASIMENRRVRDEDKEWDFRRRTLDEIVSWVTEARRCCIPPSGAGKEAFREWGRGIITTVSSEGEWATMTANIFGQEFRDKVANANEVVMAFCNKLREIDESSEATDESIRESMAQHFKSMLIATGSVLEAALKLKIEYKL